MLTLSYSTILACALVCVFGVNLWVSTTHERSRDTDLGLGGVVGALILGRILHVLLHWGYFAFHTDEIMRLSAGGTDWRGATLGALLSTAVLTRIRGGDVRVLWARWAWVLPFLGVEGWWACQVAGCAYGAEVPRLTDYPSFVAGEAYDIFGISAPRFYTQSLGMAFMAGWCVVAFIGQWREWRPTLGVVLVGMSLTMFGLGFWRGDVVAHLAGLRADQWLDLGMALLGIAIWRYMTPRIRPTESLDAHQVMPQP